MDNAPDGLLNDIDPADIADGACWEGEPQAFLKALIHAKWVDDEDGVLTVHDWYDYAGKLIEKRKSDAERKRSARRLMDVPRTSDGRRVDGAGTVPNHTCSSNTNTPLPPKEDEPNPENFVHAYEQIYSRLLNPLQFEKFQSYIADGLEEPLIIHVIRKSREAGKPVNYVFGTLERMLKDGIRTMADAERAEREFRAEVEDSRRRRGGKKARYATGDLSVYNDLVIRPDEEGKPP